MIVVAPRQRYGPLIIYNRIPRFFIVGMDEMMCYHLMCFTPTEIGRFFPLLGLDTIHFRDCIAVLPKKTLAVVLIRLLYPTCYWSMID